MSKYEDKELDKIRLFWLDNTCWEKTDNSCFGYYKGEYPQKENEIMLSKTALNSMGIENPDVEWNCLWYIKPCQKIVIPER